VNFPPFLIPRKFGKFGKFGKFASHRISIPHCHKAFAASLKTREPLALCTGPGTGCPLGVVAVGVRVSEGLE
jgi:hypothetical protein